MRLSGESKSDSRLFLILAYHRRRRTPHKCAGPLGQFTRLKVCHILQRTMRSTLADYFLSRYFGRNEVPPQSHAIRQASEYSGLQDTPAESAGPMLTPTQLVVDIRNLVYTVSDRTVFDGLDIEIARGQVTAIIGPSGAGKTTLLRLITRQVSADSGSIIVAGRNLQTLPSAALYALRRRMGMLFQNSALLTDLDVFENVAFPLREHTDLPERLIRQLVLIKLHAVGLRGARSLMPSELSGGMARRVALARAIIMDPEILIYDEPFVGLDPISLGVILRLIRHLNDALGLTSIIVSHGIKEVSTIADMICLLSGGKLVARGSPVEMQSRPSEAVRQFMDGSAAGPVPFHYPASDYFSELTGRSAT
jgi:phospholipid/cholesterol/gamma-HCH transport system ATP-binding protein